MESEFTPFPSITAFFVASERTIEIKAIIDGNPSRSNLSCDFPGLLQVRTCHVTGQAVLRIIGNGNRFIQVPVSNDARHRAKDLLFGDGHAVGDMGEHRGFYVVTGWQTFRALQAPTNQSGAFFDTCPD